MPIRPRIPLYARLVATVVMGYGLAIIVGALLRQMELHGRSHLVLVALSLPFIIGISYLYLGSLLLRLKYNAWLTTVALSVVTLAINVLAVIRPHIEDLPIHVQVSWVRIALPTLVLALLLLGRQSYRVRSDMVGFRQATRLSLLVLLVALLYGVTGFTLMDQHDFHQEISLPSALHQTVDQFGLTNITVTPHTRRARAFMDSLSVVSTSAVAYMVIAFFKPLRMQFIGQQRAREKAESLLREFPSDIDDYFKLWPHDKHYFFDATDQAGVAYHVTKGIALVVGDPFGDPKKFPQLLTAFGELCFVNDWQVSFIHVGNRHAKIYEQAGLRLQKIGEEAVVDLAEFAPEKNNKYFRQIRNRFTKQGYSVEILQPPHSPDTLKRFRAISDEWLKRPGRTERRLLLGYYEPNYMQNCSVAVLRDETGMVQGFMNLVPTFIPHTANYDLLRCSESAPGNSNDFLVLNVIESLEAVGIVTLNLGLCPLSGLDEKAEDATVVDAALRFVYSNGNQLYSFSGLRRFKAKYHPVWENRYIAYSGGIRGFTRTITALNRAMKVK